jgi:IS30 family transposase
VIRNRFFNKSTNFDDVPHEEIREAESWINNYPMIIHEGLTPLEVEALCREERARLKEYKLAA